VSILPLQLLIIDDEPKLVELIAEYMRTRGHSVDVVRDGAEALRRLEQKPYDALISNLNTPKVGGMELLDGLRERGDPVAPVLITPFADLEGAVRAARRGARAVLRKPLKLGELHEALLDAVHWHREQSARLPLPHAESLSKACLQINSETAGDLLQALSDAALDYVEASLVLVEEPGLGWVPLFGAGLFPFPDPLADAEGLSRFELQIEGHRQAPAARAQLVVVGNSALTELPRRALGVYCGMVGGALSRLAYRGGAARHGKWDHAPWDVALPAELAALADPRLGTDHNHMTLWWALRTQGMRWLPAVSETQAAFELQKRFPGAKGFLVKR
jgi:DNA-binding response OmpR family regulator